MPNYLGFDLSTQTLKAIIVDLNFKVLHEAFVNYDVDLPEYKTRGGVIKHADGAVTSKASMWVKSLDLILNRLKGDGADFSSIVAISGAAQQHGCVFWSKGSDKILGNLCPGKSLNEQLTSCFSIEDSPVWMDTSTKVQCKRLESAIGGSKVLTEITGSRAHYRNTGNLIGKAYESKKKEFENTERISLISSFVCSLFLGKYAPIDFSDGSGMNLLNIRTKDYNDKCLNACAPDLRGLLGAPVATLTVTGNISQYFVDRYSFNPICSVVAFTGDNHSSLAGMFLGSSDVAFSLGTSDTMFMWLDEPKVYEAAHIFINPLDADKFMALLCCINGSYTRMMIRDEYCCKSWDIFNQYLRDVPAGSYGNIGIYCYTDEITPFMPKGRYLFDKDDRRVDKFDSEAITVRAFIESQFMSRRVQAEAIGLNFDKINRLLATGGASVNKELLQILSDIFNVPVCVTKLTNSACVGGTVLAKIAHTGSTFADNLLPQYDQICCPNAEAHQVYMGMMKRYKAAEESLCNTSE